MVLRLPPLIPPALVVLSACSIHVSMPPREEMPTPRDFWERPIVGGVKIGRLEEARLPFSPNLPDGLRRAHGLVVSDPNDTAAFREVAWVYRHPLYGRFVIRERATDKRGVAAEMREMASHEPGCTIDPLDGNEECHYGERRLVSLENGNQALLLLGDPTTYLEWVEPLRAVRKDAFARLSDEFQEPGLLVEVIGPAGEFTAAEAVAVANLV